MELQQQPERAAKLRVIESLGPAGMPPVTATTRLAESEHERLTEALVTMHHHPAGQAILARGGVRRFAPVTDRNYDDIRQMLRAIEQKNFTGLLRKNL
jgi:phosphonate transport system substrate-binding protein